jgi:hypothetical protein
MTNLDKETLEFINTLPAEWREQLIELIELIEQEKEYSWSDGYADAVDQLDNKPKRLFTLNENR